MPFNTKIDIINGAYSQLRISGLTVNPSPPDIAVALDRLEDMAHEFAGRNICTDFNFTEVPDPNDLTNVPQEFAQMFKTNLAIRLVPDFNKVVPQELRLQATQSLSNASARSAASKLQQVPYNNRMALGSGNTQYIVPIIRFQTPIPPPPNACDTHEMFVDDIDDFFEDFTSYLKSGETIISAVLTADPGLLLQSDSVATPRVIYRIKAISTVNTGNFQQVKILATTSTGRVETRFPNFDITRNNTVGTV